MPEDVLKAETGYGLHAIALKQNETHVDLRGNIIYKSRISQV